MFGNYFQSNYLIFKTNQSTKIKSNHFKYAKFDPQNILITAFLSGFEKK